MLSERQKQVLREMVNFTCEICNKHESICGKLELHRMIRGNMGGQYIPRNIKMLCRGCHKMIHNEEW